MNDHYNNDLNQRWLIIEKEIVSKGIQDQNDQSKCLDVYYSSTDNGATVSVYSRHGGQNQMWELTCIENCDVKQPNCTSTSPCGLDEGHCESNEQCTDDLVCGIDNCKPELGYSSGTNCCYYSYNRSAEYFSIINPISGKALQAMTSSTGEIEMWTFSGIDNQLWFWDGVDNDVLRNKMYPHKV